MAVARDKWATWVLETRHGGQDPSKMVAGLGPIRDRVLDGAKIEPGETVLDAGCGDGLIAFGALERVGPEGRVIFSDISQDLLVRCLEIADGDDRSEAIDSVLEPEEAERFRAHLRAKAESGDGVMRNAHAYLTAVK